MEEQLDTLQEEAQVIRDETVADENTATRVGTMLLRIIGWLRSFCEHVSTEISSIRTTVSNNKTSLDGAIEEVRSVASKANSTAVSAKSEAQKATSAAETAASNASKSVPVVCTQEQYDALEVLGTVDPNRTYFIKEKS